MNKSSFPPSSPTPEDRDHTHIDRYVLLECLYLNYAEILKRYLQSTLPFLSWEECEDCVHELFLTLAVEGCQLLGELTLWSLMKHARRTASRRLRASRRVKRGGRLFREPDDISELAVDIPSPHAIDVWIAVHDIANLLDRFDLSRLSIKEHLILQIVKEKLPQSLGPREILNLMPAEHAALFAPRNPVSDPDLCTVREVTRRRGELRKKLQEFFVEDLGN
ncbi:MAG: hypothetical protein KDN22_02945 [Verrucomicrobiae bacterium]|nr:hypothetical protein [Verrucomicrobiae bacterium]